MRSREEETEENFSYISEFNATFKSNISINSSICSLE